MAKPEQRVLRSSRSEILPSSSSQGVSSRKSWCSGLTASDRLIIPVQAQFLAMRGMAKLMQVVHKVQQRLNSDLSIAGVLITQYDGRKNLNKSVSELVQETFQGKVFSTHIRNAITLAEAPTQGQDIFHYAPKSAGAEDYEKVCNELLTEIK